MAVTITSPQSKIVARGNVTISWTHGYPQSAYEIQYREAGQTAWSTFGRVTGTATSASLDISGFQDFGLYHYRVVCYADNATSGTSTYNGSDFSAAYAIMIVPANQVATMKIKYGSGMEEVPLYSTTNRYPKLVTPHGQNPLLADTEYAAGQTKTRVGSASRAVAVPPSSLPATGQAAYAYMTQNYRYAQSYNYRLTYYSYYTRYGYYAYYSTSAYRYDTYSYRYRYNTSGSTWRYGYYKYSWAASGATTRYVRYSYREYYSYYAYDYRNGNYRYLYYYRSYNRYTTYYRATNYRYTTGYRYAYGTTTRYT